MRYLLIFAMVFSFAALQAQDPQNIHGMHKISDMIGGTADEILAFARATLEEQPSKRQPDLELCLQLPDVTIDSSNTLEIIGEYLNATTNKVLRTRIKKILLKREVSF